MYSFRLCLSQLDPFAIEPVAWRQQRDYVEQADWWFFLSPNAVTHFAVQWLEAWPLKSLIALGQGTFNALRQHCSHPILLPKQATSEGVLALDELQHIQQQSIALIKGRNGRTTLMEQLTARGAQVRNICCYQRVPQHMDIAPLIKIWQNRQRITTLATSSEALTLFAQQLTSPLGSWVRQQPLLLTSQRLYQQAQALGFCQIYLASRLSDQALFDAILAIFKENS